MFAAVAAAAGAHTRVSFVSHVKDFFQCVGGKSAMEGRWVINNGGVEKAHACTRKKHSYTGDTGAGALSERFVPDRLWQLYDHGTQQQGKYESHTSAHIHTHTPNNKLLIARLYTTGRETLLPSLSGTRNQMRHRPFLDNKGTGQ